MKPTYDDLKKNHYSSNKKSPLFVEAESVFKEIGYDHQKLIQQDQGYTNTCAVRMSLALIKSGVYFSGRIKIKEGPHKGKMIEPGAKLLADQLARPDIFGTPTFVSPTNPAPKLIGEKGLIFFWKITGYGGGHIDLIEASTTVAVCNSSCQFSSKEIWFWPLP